MGRGAGAGMLSGKCSRLEFIALLIWKATWYLLIQLAPPREAVIPQAVAIAGGAGLRARAGMVGPGRGARALGAHLSVQPSAKAEKGDTSRDL